MRATVGAALLVATLSLPAPAVAQTSAAAGEPAPSSAASAWLGSGAPLFWDGAYFDPSGPTTFFDPSTMVRSGTFEGLPLYVDTTIEPGSIVYVPIGGRLMRPYERRRTGALAGTAGSRAPSFPVQLDSEARIARADRESRPAPPYDTGVSSPPSTSATPAPTTEPERRASPSPPTAVVSIPSPLTNRGVWIEFRGKVWFASGGGIPYRRGRFALVGRYRGFPVYQRGRDTTEIYVPAVTGGALVRYASSSDRDGGRQR